MTPPPSDRPEDTVDPKLLEILVCPVTKGPLEFDGKRRHRTNERGRLEPRAVATQRAQGPESDHQEGRARSATLDYQAA